MKWSAGFAGANTCKWELLHIASQEGPCFERSSKIQISELSFRLDVGSPGPYAFNPKPPVPRIAGAPAAAATAIQCMFGRGLSEVNLRLLMGGRILG